MLRLCDPNNCRSWSDSLTLHRPRCIRHPCAVASPANLGQAGDGNRGEMELRSFDGRHALITGGGSGIGAATARMLAAKGATVSLLGRRLDALQSVADETGASPFACDVTDRAALEAAFDAARAANGPFDFVILNAGIGDSAPFARTSRASFDAIIATNLTAVFDGAQLALPDLLTGADKRLIVVASVAGLKGGAYAAPYVASKHGVVGLVKSLALEFAKTSLTINAVCPSFVDTPMVDDSATRISRATSRSVDQSRDALAALNASGRLVTADEVASSIINLCLPLSRSINGALVTIDGGTSA
ncbi:MAG: SDR family oxidoreductase [Pseudomonadota bacterium]|nr:SDR family oxidoreductase [Pseudomonadota bacterium]